MLKTIDRLLPFRQVSEQDTVNQFSLDGTGVMGIFVSVSAGNLDFQHFWADESPGAAYDRTYSFRYETKTKVRACTSGDTRANVLGLTIFNVAEYDENGEKYLYYPQKAKENSVVLSGQAVPIGTRGIYTITSNAYDNDPTGGAGTNLPQVGDLVVPSNTNDGKVYFAAASEIGPDKYYDSSVTGFVDNVTSNQAYFNEQVLGKCIGTGSKFSGYAMIELWD